MRSRRFRIAAICAAVLAVVLVVCLVAFHGFQTSPSSQDTTQVVTETAAATDDASSTDAVTGADVTETSDAADTTGDDTSGTTDAAYQERVDEVAATEEAAGAGTSYEAGKALVTLKEGATVDEVNAMLATMDGVSTTSVTADDISSGYLLVDVEPTCTVADAVSELETSELVEGAQPNFIYTTMDDELGTTSDLVAATSPVTATEPVASTTSAAAADDTSDDTETSVDAAAMTDAQTAAETASDAATAQETEGAATLEVTVQSVTIDDPFASSQWALSSTCCYEAWATARCDNNVAVAIIDTGCLTSHEDLGLKSNGGNIVATYNAYNKIYGGSTTDVTDTIGHGTHVAGIVSAKTNNGIGTSGTSYNADLVIVKAASNSGGFSSKTLIEAYRWIEDNKSTYDIKVINMSLGGAGSGDEDPKDVALHTAVDTAYGNGILTVCASGNNGSAGIVVPCAEWPGDWESCLSVINLTNSPSIQRCSSSNYNVSGTTEGSSATKDISAPGTDYYSTTNNGSYGNKTGTSMASPCVAGIAALLFAQDSSATPDSVVTTLESTTTDLGDSGWDEEYGYGEVNAASAVTTKASITAGDSAVLVGGSIYLTAKATDGSTQTWTWSSADTSIAVVDTATGTVRGVAAGAVKITATSSTGLTATYYLTVMSGSITGADSIGVGSTSTYGVDCTTSGLSWTYTVNDKSVATIGSSSGVLTGKKVGTVIVTAKSTAHPYIWFTKTVTIVDLTIAGADSVTYGDTSTYSISPADTRSWTWSVSSGTGTAKINKSTGELTATGAGEVTVTATTDSGKTVLTKTVTVAPASITSVSLGYSTHVYTGSALKPTVSVYYGSTRLYSGYTVTYSNNTNVGTATVTVKGTGNYTGTKTATFKITAASISSASVSSIANQTYTGSAITPSPTVTYGGKTLTKGTDYTLSYSNNVDAGTAMVTITGKGNYTGTTTTTFKIKASVKRLWGATAMDTMSSIATAGWSTSKYVVIATGDGYWDALAASSLAGKLDCPVLLCNQDSLPSQTSATIKRLGATTAYVMGGTSAVSDSVVSAVRSCGCTTVTRVAGSNAAGTARSIANQLGSSRSKTCIVATSDGYWDALAASPYSYWSCSPIFLTEGGTLSSATLASIRSQGYTTAIICGGTSAVPASVATQLASAGLSVTRLGGATAVETSSAIARYSVAKGMSADGVSVATNDGYWDALTGAALCGRNGSVLVLASDSNRSAITGFVASNKSSINHAYVFGGTAAVSDGTYAALVSALG